MTTYAQASAPIATYAPTTVSYAQTAAPMQYTAPVTVQAAAPVVEVAEFRELSEDRIIRMPASYPEEYRMARKYCIGGNWKSNPSSLATVTELCEAFKKAKFDKSKVDVIVCCPTFYLPYAKKALGDSDIELGIQNISATGNGAFTGEITAAMAVDVGFDWCLIGHSERRALYGETIEDTCVKLQNAQAAGLKIMFCIGESLDEREAGITDAINRAQLEQALPLVTDWDKFVIAYEPVWAIGTGKVATPEQAQETQAFIRAFVAEMMGERIAMAVRIQYGGSASPDNIEGLAVNPDIDGFLVGGASLKPGFVKMIEHLSNM
jgi:triosephosphate isomerase